MFDLLSTPRLIVPQYAIREIDIPNEIARFEAALIATRVALLETKFALNSLLESESDTWTQIALLVVEDRTLIDETLRTLAKTKCNVEQILQSVASRYLNASVNEPGFSRMSRNEVEIVDSCITKVLEMFVGASLPLRPSAQEENLHQLIWVRLGCDPGALHSLSPRRFEEVVCELLIDMGYDATLTPQTHDKGRDILAVQRTPLGEFLTIVECKRHAPNRPVEINQLRSFLFTVRENDRANCGLFATSSYFSVESEKLAAEYHWQLRLADFEQLKEWISNFGRWKTSNQAGLWLPKSFCP